MLKTKTWILILVLLLAVCGIAAAFLFLGNSDSQVVEIRQDNVLIRTIDLSQVKAPYFLTIEDGRGGSNTLLVESGRICISEADCPDQICVRRGWLSGAGAPIICLPHRLVITSVSQTADASVQ